MCLGKVGQSCIKSTPVEASTRPTPGCRVAETLPRDCEEPRSQYAAFPCLALESSRYQIVISVGS